MSTIITLQQLPNQRLTATLGGNRYRITLKTTGTIMTGSIERDDRVIVSCIRLVAGTLIIPYRYQSAGNFLFITENDELPYWRQFNINQSLIYFTRSEMENAYG